MQDNVRQNFGRLYKVPGPRLQKGNANVIIARTDSRERGDLRNEYIHGERRGGGVIFDNIPRVIRMRVLRRSQVYTR